MFSYSNKQHVQMLYKFFRFIENAHITIPNELFQFGL